MSTLIKPLLHSIATHSIEFDSGKREKEKQYLDVEPRSNEFPNSVNSVHLETVILMDQISACEHYNERYVKKDRRDHSREQKS